MPRAAASDGLIRTGSRPSSLWARLTQAIHPEGLGIGALAGHWADTMPRAKGVFFNDLLEVDWAHTSHGNLSIDLCVKVKVNKLKNVA